MWKLSTGISKILLQQILSLLHGLLKDKGYLTLISSWKPSLPESKILCKPIPPPPPPRFSSHFPSVLIWSPFNTQIWPKRTSSERVSDHPIWSSSLWRVHMGHSNVISCLPSPSTNHNYLFSCLTSPVKLLESL